MQRWFRNENRLNIKEVMAIFMAKGQPQAPQTMGGAFIRRVRLLRRIRYEFRYFFIFYVQHVARVGGVRQKNQNNIFRRRHS